MASKESSQDVESNPEQMSAFPVIRKTGKLKPSPSKFLKPRTWAFIYYPWEDLGYRFKLRNISVVENWNTTLKTSGVLNYPLTDQMRMQGYMEHPFNPSISRATAVLVGVLQQMYVCYR